MLGNIWRNINTIKITIHKKIAFVIVFPILGKYIFLFSFSSRFEMVREAQIKRESKVKFILVATYII